MPDGGKRTPLALSYTWGQSGLEARFASVSNIATPSDPRDNIEEVIERWWQDHFPGSPVAQATQARNRAFAAKEDLKRRLSGAAANAITQ